MLNIDAKSIREQGDSLFSAKRTWDSRNQDIADNFYVERADFTVTRDIGDDYAEHLATGYPSMVRRDLGNSLGSMLRPKGQPWFHVRMEREDKEDHDARIWLERATQAQRRAMYSRPAMFTRATKEGDHDFAAFGGAVISTEVNRRDQSLLYRCWHLRDMAWAEDSYGQIGQNHRNWSPTVSELCNHFPKTVHPIILRRKEKEPNAKVRVRHFTGRAEDYPGITKTHPWVSVYIDCENEHVLEQRGSWTPIYTIPRWATVSGSAYPYSPASVIALPDARMLQTMTDTILRAGELAVDPPMVGVRAAIRGDVKILPGGFTAVDAEYDERLGDVLRPLVRDKNGLPFGLEMSDRMSEMLREAFYLNTISMPPAGGVEMTAYEVGQRVQEYIRNALPLFEPMEQDYNAQLCDITFETLMRENAFGPPDDIPQSLRGAETEFLFEGPLSEMIERDKGQKFLQSKAMVAEAAAVDPSAINVLDVNEALPDVLTGIGAPAKWLRSKEKLAAMAAAEKQAQESAQMLQGLQQGADVAATLGQASQSFEGTV